MSSLDKSVKESDRIIRLTIAYILRSHYFLLEIPTIVKQCYMKSYFISSSKVCDFNCNVDVLKLIEWAVLGADNMDGLLITN